MARPRARRYRDLPDNLTFDSAKGLYRYRHPITKRQHYLTNDKKACIKAAKELNQRLQPADGDLVSSVIGGAQTFTAATYRYEQDVMPDHEYSPKTQSQYETYLSKLRGCSLAKMPISQIEVTHVVDALDRLTTGDRMRNVYRHLMIQIFRCAMELGWCSDNPAEITRARKTKRQRMRLTMEGYRAVRKAAPPWLRAAMDLALITLQRPEDLVAARYSDIVDDELYIRQQKTGTKLRISVGPELAEAIALSRDGKACPFIIHEKPKRVRKSKIKQHPMQVTVGRLGKEFAKARDASGFYAKADNPPAFYEIKSLGGDRYRQMGWPESAIQALYGHTDREMTEHYLEGHEAPWEGVASG